jgi:hypothetical protein
MSGHLAIGYISWMTRVVLEDDTQSIPEPDD